MGPYQLLPLRARVYLGAMAMKTTPQSSSITGTLPSDCLVLYLRHGLRGVSYLTAEMVLVYSTALADWQWQYCGKGKDQSLLISLKKMQP